MTADAVAQRILEVLAEPFDTPTRQVYIGASIGLITAVSGAGPDSELRRADTAMYIAKAGGRNRIHRDDASPPAGTTKPSMDVTPAGR